MNERIPISRAIFRNLDPLDKMGLGEWIRSNQNIRKRIISYASLHANSSFNWPSSHHINFSYAVNKFSDNYYTIKKTNYGQIMLVLILSEKEKKHFEQLEGLAKENFILHLKKQHLLPFSMNDFEVNLHLEVQFQLGTVIRIFESEVIVGKFTSNTYFSFPVKVINLIKETLKGKIILHEELGPYYRY